MLPLFYRKRRLDTKSEDAIGLEPMETPMSERKTNVYYDDTDGKSMFILRFLNLMFFFKRQFQLLIIIHRLRVCILYLSFHS